MRVPNCRRLLYLWVRHGRSFTEEYKLDAVALLIDGNYSVPEVTKKLGVSETTIRKWMRKYGNDKAVAEEQVLTESERAELVRLRQENAHLELQLEFAKKVSTWFAKG